MAKRYMTRDNTTGQYTLVEGTSVSAGVPNAGDIVALGPTGKLDLSVLPTGTGPTTYVGNAHTNLTAGMFVYIRPDGKVAKASAAVGGTPARGFVLAAVTVGNPAIVYFGGRNDQLSGLTVGAQYYLSTTDGLVTDTPVTGAGLGSYHQEIGIADTTTSLVFDYSGYTVKRT